MTVSEIDWVVVWKSFRYEFCLIYVSTGVLIRFLFAKRVKPNSLGKASVYAVSSSIVSTVLSTWLPFAPILGVAILTLIAGHSAAESLPVSAPIIAVSLGIETTFADAMVFQVLMKPANGRFRTFFFTNTMNAILALAFALVWAFRHMPNFIAALIS